MGSQQWCNAAWLDGRGLPDSELFQYVYEAGVLAAPVAPTSRSAIGKVLRYNTDVVRYVREQSTARIQRARG